MRSWARPASRQDVERAARAVAWVRENVLAEVRRQGEPASWPEKGFKVHLGGSFAHGTATSTSDVDVVVAWRGALLTPDRGDPDWQYASAERATYRTLANFAEAAFGSVLDDSGVAFRTHHFPGVAVDVVPALATGDRLRVVGGLFDQFTAETVTRPALHKAALDNADASTGGRERARRVVRSLKGLRDFVHEVAGTGGLPTSHLIESVVVAAPSDCFSQSVTASAHRVLQWFIGHREPSTLDAPDGRGPLFGSMEKWTAESAKAAMTRLFQPLDSRNVFD